MSDPNCSANVKIDVNDEKPFELSVKGPQKVVGAVLDAIDGNGKSKGKFSDLLVPGMSSNISISATCDTPPDGPPPGLPPKGQAQGKPAPQR